MENDAASEFGERDRKRIRAEMRYAQLVLNETRSGDKDHKSIFEKFLSYLSNGFVLLIVGSVITAYFVPRYQQNQHNKEQQLSLMRDCFSQFLLYTNSIWEEYYVMIPLVQESKMEKEQYNKHLNVISEIKLKRYDAYAQVVSLAIVFRSKDSVEKSDIELALHNYAVKINQISEEIDTWLRNLYCYPSKCLQRVPSGFSSYRSFQLLQRLSLSS